MTKREFIAARNLLGLHIAASMCRTFGVPLAVVQLWNRTVR